MNSPGNDGYRNFLIFAPIHSSLILDTYKKVTNWISTVTSSKKIKLFDTNLEPTMSSLANGSAMLKFNNSVLVHKSFYSLYSHFIFNLYIIYELNNWPHDPTNNSPLKSCLFSTVKFATNVSKSKFTYNGWGIAFEAESFWSFDNNFASNVEIYSDDNSSSAHTDN